MKKGSGPQDVYVRIVYSANTTRENQEVYLQKAPDSDEFICADYEQMPVGQHMIEFLSTSNAELPRIVAEIRKHMKFVESQSFDHHLMPVHVEEIYNLFLDIRNLHPWWAACFPMGTLAELLNSYSFYSIHPSPYLIETYDEVDRLMEEETCWRDLVDQMQIYLNWFKAYIRHLKSFEQALTCCLDSTAPDALSSLSLPQRAFVFRSFFEDLFLHRSQLDLVINLQEKYSSPLGTSVNRSMLLPPDTGRLQDLMMNNMNFDEIVYEESSPLKIGSLVSMVGNKSAEITTSLLLYRPESIYSVCASSFFMLITSNTRIKKCKNCGEYFVPLNRSDEVYCCRMQKNGKRCRELDYSDKIDADVLLSIYRTAYKTHNARKQRSMKSNSQAEQKFKEWVVFAKQLLAHAQAGELSLEEYTELIKK